MSKAEIEKEQKTAKRARANLLRTWSQKAPSSSNSDTDRDTDIEEIPPPKRQKIKRQNSDILEVVRNNGNLMATAVKELAKAISSSSKGSGSERTTLEEKVARTALEEKVAKLEGSVQETNQRTAETN